MVCSAPFYWIQLYGGDPFYYLLVGSILSFTGLLALLNFNNIRIQTTYLLLFTSIFLGFSVITFVHIGKGQETEMFRYMLGFLFKCSLVLILFFSDREYFFAKLYVKFSVALCILVLITLALVLLGLWPFEFFHQPMPTKYVFNYLTTFSPSIREFGGFQYPRMSSFLDEPGSFAFLIAMAILINNRFTKIKNSETILLITGLLTFSLAFYVFSLVYILLKGGSLYFRVAYFFLFLIIGFSLYFLFDLFSEIFNQFFRRATWDEQKGSFYGDNRFVNAVYPEDLIFGDGLKGGRDSIIGEINNIGIFGLLVTYTPFFVIAYRSFVQRKLNYDSVFIICALTLLLQRPAIEKLYIFLPVYYYMHAMIYESRKK